MEAIEAITHDESLSDALAPGDKLLMGQYEILRYLNSGGFGITYLAKDSLNRTVVIKECFPESFCARVNKTVHARSRSHTDDFRAIVELFVKEAHALSRLNHPSVVGVHQVFEDNATAYMALDLVEGLDLLDIIEAGSPAISPAHLYKITLKLLDAVAHVHEEDLLHRDISPDNVLISEDGHPVLIDFGAAREEASRKSRVLSSVLVVKDGYSPPEFYVKGSAQGPSSDLYALAATLSHAITGEAPPHSQVRLAALAEGQADPYTPLAGRFPAYDDRFLAALDQAMEIIPSRRLQSAEDWVRAIDLSKRVEDARNKAQSDATLDTKVTQLVEWSRREAEAERVQDKTSTRDDRQAATKATDAEAEVGGGPTAEVIDLRPQVDPTIRIYQPSERKRPALTPYERVKSSALKRAVETQSDKAEPAPPMRKPQRLNRFASVPVVFCAYLFYGQTAFEQHTVHAATIQPLMAFSTTLSEEIEGLRTPAEPQRPTVLVNRGLNG